MGQLFWVEELGFNELQFFQECHGVRQVWYVLLLKVQDGDFPKLLDGELNAYLNDGQVWHDVFLLKDDVDQEKITFLQR